MLWKAYCDRVYEELTLDLLRIMSDAMTKYEFNPKEERS